jgi:hypothetical protein
MSDDVVLDSSSPTNRFDAVGVVIEDGKVE